MCVYVCELDIFIGVINSRNFKNFSHYELINFNSLCITNKEIVGENVWHANERGGSVRTTEREEKVEKSRNHHISLGLGKVKHRSTQQ